MCTPDGSGCALAAPGGGFASVADALAGWTGRIDHAELQPEADRILVDAAAAGADLDDLKLLAQAAYEAWRAQEPDPDDDPRGRRFGDRYLLLDTTLDGAGHITGDLTPECAAAIAAVIEALGKSRGPEDFRSAAQRYHDALQEGWATNWVSCWVAAGGRCRSAAGSGAAGRWRFARPSTETACTNSVEETVTPFEVGSGLNLLHDRTRGSTQADRRGTGGTAPGRRRDAAPVGEPRARRCSTSPVPDDRHLRR